MAHKYIKEITKLEKQKNEIIVSNINVDTGTKSTSKFQI